MQHIAFQFYYPIQLELQFKMAGCGWPMRGGAADAITASFSPAVTALKNGMTLSVRSSSANATTTPTFTPNSGVVAAAQIVKGAGITLIPGDIAGGGHWIDLQWDATLGKWVLLNPAYMASGSAGSLNGAFAGATGITGSSTLTASQFGNLFELGGSASYITYVPRASSAGNDGAALYFFNNTGYDQTIAIQAVDTGDYFFGPGIPSGSPTSIILTTWQSMMLVSDGYHWIVFSGSYIAGSMKGFFPISTSGTTIDTSKFGALIEFTNASAGSTTIPSAFNNNGAVLAFTNNGAGAQTLNPVDHGFYFNGASGTSFTLPSGQSVRFISDGVNWGAFDGSWVVQQLLANYTTTANLAANYAQQANTIGYGQTWQNLNSSRFIGNATVRICELCKFLFNLASKNMDVIIYNHLIL